MAKKYMIWESDPWLEDEEIQNLREDCPDELADASDDEVREFYACLNQDYLDDERANLGVPVSGDILCIADLGFWHGRRQGYKIIQAKVVADILYSHVDGMSEIEFYSDGYNIRATESHHDGTNFYLFREIREGVNIDNLTDRIYSGEKISASMLNRYTKSLHPYVAQVYGWPSRQKKAA